MRTIVMNTFKRGLPFIRCAITVHIPQSSSQVAASRWLSSVSRNNPPWARSMHTHFEKTYVLGVLVARSRGMTRH